MTVAIAPWAASPSGRSVDRNLNLNRPFATGSPSRRVATLHPLRTPEGHQGSPKIANTLQDHPSRGEAPHPRDDDLTCTYSHHRAGPGDTAGMHREKAFRQGSQAPGVAVLVPCVGSNLMITQQHAWNADGHATASRCRLRLSNPSI